jgi:hypothetical protein
VDAGDLLFKNLELADFEREQRTMKAELLLEAQAKLGVDVLTPGDGDLAFGLAFLVDGAKKNSLSYVSANLATPGGGLVFPASMVIERAGLKIGITGAISEEYAFEDAKPLPAHAAVQGAVEGLRADGVDLVILLSHLGLKGDRAIAEAVPGIDLIFGGDDRRHQESPVVVGTTAIFQAGSRSKYVGEATFEFVPGATGWADPAGRATALRQKERTAQQVTRYEKQLGEATDDATKKRLERVLMFARKRLEGIEIPAEATGPANTITSTKIPMGASLADEAEMKALVDAMLEKMGPQVGGDDHGDHSHGPGGHGKDIHADKSKIPPFAGPYVMSRTCRSCHPAQYKDWTGTGHSHAYATLMKEKRQYDLQCWSCHVTGAGKKGGPEKPSRVAGLSNVQCEACHGPGKDHVEKPGKDNIVRAPDQSVCLECHTEEQTEGSFVYDEYLSRIDHLP